MIVQAFDGRNISVVFDAMELKVVNAFLKRISPQQTDDVLAELKAAGFNAVTSADCAVLAQAVNAVAGTLLASVNMIAVAEEVELDSELDKEEAQPKPKAKKTPLVN
jgi:hypothetical protein